MASAPAKPLLIYDGDCAFCARWVRRWQQATGDLVDYVPFQDANLAVRFPGLPREQLRTAVHLIAADGAVCRGAEAVFRALAEQPHERWLLDWYEHSPTFAGATEWAYRFVARHRTLFSTFTRLVWGRHTEPPEHFLVCWVFLRCLGVIYLAAFLSLWAQVSGLIGSNGILPAKLTMEAARRQMTAANVGAERYHALPTLCWFDTSDRFLKLQCAAGVVLAALLIIGLAPAPCLFLLWLIYLSLTTVSRDFLGFQWDNLLLETGLLAIFLSPLRLLPGLSGTAPPSRIVLWLLRWLLFRLMFESGCVKLLSGDPAWRNLTALRFHFETQPLPTWLGWYAHQLPVRAQTISTAIMFIIELGVPFMIFAPGRLRQIGGGTLIALQLAILLTGNYCFFNLLTIALCLLLLDDDALRRLVPSRWRSSPVLSVQPAAGAKARGQWLQLITVPLAVVVILISLLQFLSMARLRGPWPRPLIALYSGLAPFRSFNSYGLFAVMTTSRLEIIVEGSNDGVAWLPYEFKYKPGDVKRRPRFVEPHQPRLDWQMWFAALGDYRHNRWLINFCVRLLEGSPEVLSLLERNPFPNAPPRYIRAMSYEYHFTDFTTRRETGAWWRREPKGEYMPVISLRERQ